ncbi:MAG: DUF2232 domain-containing protein [Clostridia bacterium]|nr:DUF2232 domain-containing protein [Clostridia bacterium]
MATIKTKHAIAGAVLGVMSGFGMMVALAFSPIALLPTIIISLLGIWAGLPSALVATASNLFVAYSLGGGILALVVIETMIIPAWCVIALIARRTRYYDGIKQSVFMQCGALFVLVVGARLAIGEDIVEYLMNSLRGAINSYPEEYVQMFVAYMGQAGLFGSQTGLDFTQAIPSEQLTALLDAFFAAYTTELNRSLVSMLLTTGVVTGAASYGLSAFIVSRRGDDPIIDYAHPCDWRLSPSLIIGPPACALIFYIAYNMGTRGADSAYLAMYSLCVLLFMAQGAGAVDRWFRKTGATKSIRLFIIAVLVITGLRNLLAIAGVISALGGSEGLISKAIKKHNDKGDGTF